MTALILVALAVAVDSFAVAMAFGLAGASRRARLETAVVFGLFQGGMPLAGVELGSQLSRAIGSDTRPAGAALLCLTGAYGVISELRSRRADRDAPAQGASADAASEDQDRRPWRVRLWLAAIAVSVDNLVAGLALGAYHVSPVAAFCVFALVGAGLALLGAEFGHRAGDLLQRLSTGRLRRFGDLGELLASSALVVVGLALGLG